jgi:hypothetical protein
MLCLGCKSDGKFKKNEIVSEYNTPLSEAYRTKLVTLLGVFVRSDPLPLLVSFTRSYHKSISTITGVTTVCLEKCKVAFKK